MNDTVLDRVFQTIVSRRGTDPQKSYTASLLARGHAHVARKVGEEALETVIAAVAADHKAIVAESADLLFHLLVLLADHGLQPADVFAELERREGTSGVTEKASRSR